MDSRSHRQISSLLRLLWKTTLKRFTLIGIFQPISNLPRRYRESCASAARGSITQPNFRTSTSTAYPRVSRNPPEYADHMTTTSGILRAWWINELIVTILFTRSPLDFRKASNSFFIAFSSAFRNFSKLSYIIATGRLPRCVGSAASDISRQGIRSCVSRHSVLHTHTHTRPGTRGRRHRKGCIAEEIHIVSSDGKGEYVVFSETGCLGRQQVITSNVDQYFQTIKTRDRIVALETYGFLLFRLHRVMPFKFRVELQRWDPRYQSPTISTPDCSESRPR
jgi:hypothetical protein